MHGKARSGLKNKTFKNNHWTVVKVLQELLS
jgi:hypothetical protein